MTKRIAVLGAGTWGTALASMLSRENGCDVTLWSAIGEEIAEIARTRTHPKLHELVIPDGLRCEVDIATALDGAEIVMLAVPSPYVRSTARLASPYISENAIIVDVAKGLEKGTHMTLCEVIADELGGKKGGIAALSGPTHAEEVAAGLPTAIVASSDDIRVAEDIQKAFSNRFFRVYTNSDIKGIEICGAMKNIIAVAAGISDGLGFGDNAKAAIITRGMAEITRLGVAMGCSGTTFESLAGIGDLVVTCTSKHSRNCKAGRLIGGGMSPNDAVAEVGMTVEGLNALPAAIEFAESFGVELPICETLGKVIGGEIMPGDALFHLMSRDLKSEI